jgi:hypothetical protein
VQAGVECGEVMRGLVCVEKHSPRRVAPEHWPRRVGTRAVHANAARIWLMYFLQSWGGSPDSSYSRTMYPR